MAEPTRPALTPVGTVASWLPHGWTHTSFLSLHDPVNDVLVTAWLEPLDADVDLAAYADRVEAAIFAGREEGNYGEAIEATIIAGLPSRARVLGWTNEAGVEVMTLLAFARSDGAGVRAHVTAPAAVFPDQLPLALGLLESLNVTGVQEGRT